MDPPDPVVAKSLIPFLILHRSAWPASALAAPSRGTTRPAGDSRGTYRYPRRPHRLPSTEQRGCHPSRPGTGEGAWGYRKVPGRVPWCCKLGFNLHWNQLLKSLRRNGVIRCHMPCSTMDQAVACCLAAPSHYLNPCWLILNWTPLNTLHWNWNQKNLCRPFCPGLNVLSVVFHLIMMPQCYCQEKIL